MDGYQDLRTMESGDKVVGLAVVGKAVVREALPTCLIRTFTLGDKGPQRADS